MSSADTPAVRFDAERTALLVIDMQRDFLDPRGYATQAGVDVSRLRATLGPVCALVAAAREAGMHIVYTREGHRPDLSDCPPAKLERSRHACAEIGSSGPLGRLLVRGEPGHGLVDELQPRGDEPIVDKPGYSAFHQTELDQILRGWRIDTVILCGVTTEVCVHTTLRAATDHGLHCVTVGDACAASDPALQQPALDMIAVEGGIFGTVTDSESLIAQLRHSANKGLG
ncbi:MAG: cysteine hydrolase [Pseudomonadota bacterium]|nr:cysteine hydrolase [Pseudomonadota bacterium]